MRLSKLSSDVRDFNECVDRTCLSSYLKNENRKSGSVSRLTQTIGVVVGTASLPVGFRGIFFGVTPVKVSSNMSKTPRIFIRWLADTRPTLQTKRFYFKMLVLIYQQNQTASGTVCIPICYVMLVIAPSPRMIWLQEIKERLILKVISLLRLLLWIH